MTSERAVSVCDAVLTEVVHFLTPSRGGEWRVGSQRAAPGLIALFIACEWNEGLPPLPRVGSSLTVCVRKKQRYSHISHVELNML